MKRTLGALTAVGIVSMAGHASAEGAKRPKHHPVESPAERLFGRLDADDDGQVSRSELFTAALRHVAERCDQRFEQLDKDGNGRVSRNEVQGMDQERFSRLDLNSDGSFTAMELRVFMHAQAAQRLERVFARMDVDRDGNCTRDELVALSSTETSGALARADVSSDESSSRAD